jgi:hypothetical protein
MMWGGKQKIYENILKFRTLNTNIRTWVDRDARGPTEEQDYDEIAHWVATNRQQIDSQPLLETAEQIALEFKRCSAIEVMNGSLNTGVLIYPRWP